MECDYGARMKQCLLSETTAQRARKTFHIIMSKRDYLVVHVVSPKLYLQFKGCSLFIRSPLLHTISSCVSAYPDGDSSLMMVPELTIVYVNLVAVNH
jgi:hypothetical protein